MFHNYVRLKIFNQDGRDKAARIEIAYGEKSSVTNVAGRTIRPDGTIIELKKDAIHQEEVVRASGLKRKVTSFAMPGVEVGAIVEYRWTEVHSAADILYSRLQFQREYPVRRVKYYVKPLSGPYMEYTMSMWPFNCKPTTFLKQETNGFSSTTVENVPAFREEPLMPAEPQVRPWALLFYHKDANRRDPEKYRLKVAKDTYGDLKASLKTDNALKQAAGEAVQGATTDQDKVDHLIRYVRAHVRDVSDRRVTDAERAEWRRKYPRDRYRTSAEVFTSGLGDADELNTLFAALALEVGLEARPALVSDREELGFDKRLPERYFLRNIDMAVQIGDKWQLYDVSARLLPPDMLRWQEENTDALLTDPKQLLFIRSAMTPPEKSLSGRKATLVLSEDGTLEGDVVLSWTGHPAYERRVEFDGESETRRLEMEKERILKVWPQAEVSALRLENVDDPEKALHLTYHIRIPAYAEGTGKRLFFQPFFFERRVS